MYFSTANFLQKKFNFDAHYFLRGGFWLSLTQVIVVLAGILTTSLFAHYLSETDYGIYRYLIGLAVLFSSLSLTGLGQSILQTAAKKYYGFYQETITINFIYNLGVLFSALAGAGYYFYKGNIVLSIGCLLIAVLQPIINSFQFTSTYLQGSGRFRESTILQTVKTLFITIICLGSLFLTKSILILIGTYLISTALISTISYFWFKTKKYTPTPSDVYNKYLTYAKHTSVRNILSSIAYRLDSIVIFTYLGAAPLAIYTIATIIPEQIKGVFKNLASLLLPKYAAHQDYSILKKSISKRSFQLFLILVGITIIYILVAPYIYNLLFPKYQAAVLYSQITAVAFPAFIFLVPMSFLQALKDETRLYKITVYGSVFQIISLLVFVFYFGLMGAIVAKVIYRYFVLASVFLTFRK